MLKFMKKDVVRFKVECVCMGCCCVSVVVVIVVVVVVIFIVGGDVCVVAVVGGDGVGGVGGGVCADTVSGAGIGVGVVLLFRV